MDKTTFNKIILNIRNMHICVISPAYPYTGIPVYTFVEQFCVAMAKLGNKVTVFAPQSILNICFKNQTRIPSFRKDYYGDVCVAVYSPLGFSGYNVPFIGKYLNRFSAYLIQRKIRHHRIKPDVFYGHFWLSGLSVFEEAKRQNCPLFVASGESTIRLVNNTKRVKKFCNYVNGVICVSTKNKNESIAKGLTVSEKCIVVPNAINATVFKKKHKEELRQKLGFGKDDFIVAYVGYFCHRKGTLRLSDAIDLIKDQHVKSIFIGSNLTKEDYSPRCSNILFKGRLPHDLIPDYLNCADVFVLPTLHEGCCNAIIEAMACGLPIISSARDFNEDILDNTCSILVDPLNIDEIAKAIQLIRDDIELRNYLSEGALRKAKAFDIYERAQKISNYINQMI